MKKLPRFRVRRNPKGNAAFKDSSSLILSFAGIVLTAWGVTPDDTKTQILQSIGVDPYHLAFISFVGVVISAFLAKHTSVVREQAGEPEQHTEDPDHDA